jgi:hypothetical protein
MLSAHAAAHHANGARPHDVARLANLASHLGLECSRRYNPAFMLDWLSIAHAMSKVTVR